MRVLVTLLVLALLSASCATIPSNPTAADQLIDPTGELVYKEDEDLQNKLAEIANAASSKVGVFALLMEDSRSVSVNGNERFAMQSVVKLPVAMAVMRQVRERKFHAERHVYVEQADMVGPPQRSPIRDEFPKGVQVTISGLIAAAIVESDGTACDVLTRIAGGAPAVQAYIDSLEIDGIEMKRTHKEFGKNWDMQYENWATPEAAVQLLEALMPPDETGQRDLDPTYTIIYERMLESIPGKNRLKGLLPPGTPVAHKTGTGGTRSGITSATNDVGIITLPNGKHVAIAVFVGDSSADEKSRELVIANVAKAVWDTWANTK